MVNVECGIYKNVSQQSFKDIFPKPLISLKSFKRRVCLFDSKKYIRVTWAKRKRFRENTVILFKILAVLNSLRFRTPLKIYRQTSQNEICYTAQNGLHKIKKVINSKLTCSRRGRDRGNKKLNQN